jgi:hypothetical protein
MRFLRWIVGLSVLLTAGAALGVNHHWGVYIQGHAPAIVPYHSQFGFNEQRWRRWPGDCTDGHEIYTDTVPAEKVKSPEAAPPSSELPPPADEEDYAPPPPGDTGSEPAESPSMEEPSGLEPLPSPDDLRPEAPPGLEPTESEPPSDLPPTLEPSTEPAAEPATEPAATPNEPTPADPMPPAGTTPGPTSPTPTNPTPGTPLPLPPTKLETRRNREHAPPGSRRDVDPVQAQRDRFPLDDDAREAVFRQNDRARPIRSNVPKQLGPAQRAVKMMPERKAESSGNNSSDELQLVPPIRPDGASIRWRSPVAHVSYEERREPGSSTPAREMPSASRTGSAGTEGSAVIRTPEENSTAKFTRVNPLRSADSSEARETSTRTNPLRP